MTFVITFLTSDTVESRLHARFVNLILRLSTGRYFKVFLVLILRTSCFELNLLTAFKYMCFHCSLRHELDISWLKDGSSFFPRVLLVMKKKLDKTYVNYV